MIKFKLQRANFQYIILHASSGTLAHCYGDIYEVQSSMYLLDNGQCPSQMAVVWAHNNIVPFVVICGERVIIFGRLWVHKSRGVHIRIATVDLVQY